MGTAAGLFIGKTEDIMAVFNLRETGAQIQNLLSGIRGMTGVL